ncbi:MAG: zf-HC2 domain-containing protein [Gaiellaceae bacterium]
MRSLLGKLMKPDPRECEETRALMSDYVDGDLDDELRRRVERHVRFCPRCHAVLGNLRETLARLRGLGDDRPGDEEEAVAARVSRAWRDRA